MKRTTTLNPNLNSDLNYQTPIQTTSLLCKPELRIHSQPDGVETSSSLPETNQNEINEMRLGEMNYWAIFLSPYTDRIEGKIIK
jgi:hypothetical protein